MANAVGIGFREIWRPQLSNHGRRMEIATNRPGLDVPKLNNPFSNNFGPPSWIDLVIPDSQYLRAGLNFNLVQSEEVNLTVRGTCGVTGKFDCSGTVNLFGKHNLGGG